MEMRSYFGDVRFFYFNDYGKLELFYILKNEAIQKNIATKNVSIFVNPKQFCFLCI